MTQTGRQRGDDKWVWEEERRKMCHKVFTVAVMCVCGQLGLIFLLQLSNVCLYNTPFPFSVLSRFPAHCLIVLHLFKIILICLKSHFTFLFPLISLLLRSIALLLHVWKNFPLRGPRSEELNTQAPPSQIQNTAQDY